jgi:hypothetical protein
MQIIDPGFFTEKLLTQPAVMSCHPSFGIVSEMVGKVLVAVPRARCEIRFRLSSNMRMVVGITPLIFNSDIGVEW